MIRPTFSLRTTLKNAWLTFRLHPWMLVGLALFVIGFTGFFQQVQVVTSRTFGSGMQYLVFALVLVAEMVLAMGLTNIGVRAVRGKTYGFRDLFRPGEMFGQYVLATLFYCILLFVGFWLTATVIELGAWTNINLKILAISFLNLVWYFIFGIQYMFYSYFLVDRKMNAFSALRASARIVGENRGKLMMAMLFIMTLNILGAGFFFIGLIITVPLSIITVAQIYIGLTHAHESNEAMKRIDPATVVHG